MNYSFVVSSGWSETDAVEKRNGVAALEHRAALLHRRQAFWTAFTLGGDAGDASLHLVLALLLGFLSGFPIGTLLLVLGFGSDRACQRRHSRRAWLTTSG